MITDARLLKEKPLALLFDLDGTLVDTAPDFYQAVNALRAELSLTPLADDKIRTQVSNGGRALTRLALTNDEQPDFERHYQRLLALYSQVVGQDCLLFAGIEDLLTACQAKHIPWGIVTNKPKQYAKPLMIELSKRHPILNQCATLICPDDVRHSKPAPDALLLAATQLSIEPEQCWYIGDHVRDIQAAKAANMASIAVSYGYLDDGDDTQSWQADHVVEHADDLSALLNSSHPTSSN